MPVINLRVDEATRELWVQAASGQLLTLSEWIRQACDARLGLADRFVDMPLSLELPPTLLDEVAATEAIDTPVPTDATEDLSHPPDNDEPSAVAAAPLTAGVPDGDSFPRAESADDWHGLPSPAPAPAVRVFHPDPKPEPKKKRR